MSVSLLPWRLELEAIFPYMLNKGTVTTPYIPLFSLLTLALALSKIIRNMNMPTYLSTLTDPFMHCLLKPFHKQNIRQKFLPASSLDDEGPLRTCILCSLILYGKQKSLEMNPRMVSFWLEV